MGDLMPSTLRSLGPIPLLWLSLAKLLGSLDVSLVARPTATCNPLPEVRNASTMTYEYLKQQQLVLIDIIGRTLQLP